MNQESKRERLKEKINSHLRRIARQLVKFDTLDETLHYLLESFWMDFTCDFVAIVLLEQEYLIPKVWKGNVQQFEHSFPIPLACCSPNLLKDALWWPNENITGADRCEFQKTLEAENLSTWFTVPLKDDTQSYGFCIIGFRNFVSLVLEAERMFVEFGKDVAVAMALAKEKEKQKKKMKGIEWIRENLFLGSSLEQLVGNIVERAGKGTRAGVSYIFLYDELENCLVFQPPAYGSPDVPPKIQMKNYMLNEYFPYLEMPHGDQLTVPLIVNLKTIGVLHVANKLSGAFTLEDVELLQFLSNHVSALIENARLYRNEREHKQRLQRFMAHHRELVKQTLESEQMDQISNTLSGLLNRPVVLFDRFLRPISFHLQGQDERFLHRLVTIIQQHEKRIKQMVERECWVAMGSGNDVNVGIWTVVASGDQLGYLAVAMPVKELDDVIRLTIDHALNVYAIQFIKQKLVIESADQVKENFIQQFLMGKIDDQEKIIQYANLFHWDLFRSHRVAVLSVRFPKEPPQEANLLQLEVKKSILWEKLKDWIVRFQKDVLLARTGEEFILIVPTWKKRPEGSAFWKSLYEQIKKVMQSEDASAEVYLGVGGEAKRLEDYHFCYKQAIQAHNVVAHWFRDQKFALFEDLGAYTLLHHLQDVSVAKLFVRKYLLALLKYSEGKGVDLFQTLRMYLYHNGNLTETADALYIHRSTLLYRLEKITELLGLSLTDAENRFSLMMAYKLYELFDFSSSDLMKK